MMHVNFQEVLKRIIKYLVEGLMVAIACYAIPKASMNIDEIGYIALVAAATFSILDTYIPLSLHSTEERNPNLNRNVSSHCPSHCQSISYF